MNELIALFVLMFGALIVFAVLQLTYATVLYFGFKRKYRFTKILKKVVQNV